MHGLLIVDKPVDWTSFDVVNYVRRIVANQEGKRPKSVKVGHAGTLDPFATGLLMVLIGKEYTRRASQLTKLDKTYEVILKLGTTSVTGDIEGELTSVSDMQPSYEDLGNSLKNFIGEIEQIPPVYSAIKVNGQRAYKLARAGQKITMASRQVTIHRLELLSYDYPEVNLNADVSSGTYIRSLVEDIGELLGVGAYTLALRRTRVGEFDLVGAVDPKSLTPSILEHSLKQLD